MNRLPFAALAVVLLLFACFPKKPEVRMTAQPPEPLLQALEQHRQEFISLKGLASVTIDRRGMKRTFDTAGVVIDGRDRIRIEAFSPLGQSVAAIVWNGRELLMRMPGDESVTRTGPERMERLLGRGVEPSELCSILSGNIPDPGPGTETKLLCTEGNDCIMELRSGSTFRRVMASLLTDGRKPRIRTYELYRSDSLLFSARFDEVTEITGYHLPMRIVIESPGDHFGMTLVYSEIEVNGSLESGSFLLDDDAGLTPAK